MKLLCVDDEEKILQRTVSLCRELPRITEVMSFTNPADALDWHSEHTADIALLDICMPGMDGLTLASKIIERSPDTAIIFLTRYTKYALDAFALHASGYIRKPATRERLAAEIAHALAGRPEEEPSLRISAKTFGEFDLMVNGELVTFSRARSKELLAYLVDRQGSSVTRASAFAVLWEDEFYDRPMQKQLDVVIRSLRATLAAHGISELLEMRNGTLRIRPEMLECDLYRFFDGDIAAVNAYRGEYMSSYSWASMTEAYMDRINRPQ